MNSTPAAIPVRCKQFGQNTSNLKMTIRRYTTTFSVLLALTILYFLPEEYFNSGLNDFSYCMHKQLLGFGCPGCGLTRATYYLIHLKPLFALELNASVVFVIPTIFGELLYQLLNTEWSRNFRFIVYFIFCLSLFSVYLIRILTAKF
jgi:hypothetical protein